MQFTGFSVLQSLDCSPYRLGYHFSKSGICSCSVKTTLPAWTPCPVVYLCLHLATFLTCQSVYPSVIQTIFFPFFLASLNLNSFILFGIYVNYIFHWLPHFVFLLLFVSFLYSRFMHFNFCHIPFSKPTSTKASALIKSQRKGHNISQTLRLRGRRTEFEKRFVGQAEKTVVFLTRILEIPGSNVGQSQSVLKFFVGSLFSLSKFHDTSHSLRWLSSTFFIQVICLLAYHPQFDAI